MKCHSEPNLSRLREKARYPSGEVVYMTNDYNSPEIRYNSRTKILKFSGSIMYLYQSHNFSFDMRDFIAAIESLSQSVGVNLWAAVVEEFEFGVVMEVDTKPQILIAHHPDGKKLKTFDNPTDNGRLRTYTDTSVRLKLYDAGANIIKKIRKPHRQAALDAGWNPNRYYLKLEAHYRQPHKTFNNGRNLTLRDLTDPARIEQFRNDLYKQYKRLRPMKTLVTPSDKKDLSAAEILLMELAETHINSGMSIQKVRKRLYQRTNSLSKTLSTSDKDARKRTIKTWIDKLQFEEKSRFDLSEPLAEMLGISAENSRMEQ